MEWTYCKIVAIACCLTTMALNVNASETNFETGFGQFTNPASGSGYKSFTRRTGATPSGGTGPNSGAENSNYYVYMETSSGAAHYAGDTAILTSGSATASHVSFYYHMYGLDIGTLAVEILDGSVWRPIWQISGQQQTSASALWVKQTLALSLKPEVHKVRFVTIAKGGYRGDIAIDQIKFESPTEPNLIYQYDTLGRLTLVEDSIIGNKSYDYDPAGNRKTVTGNSSTPPENTPPVAKNDSVYLYGLYQTVKVNVLANDTDADGDNLNITAINNSDGRLSVSNAGGGNINVMVVYSSSSSFSTGFTYTVSDGTSQSTATVSVYFSNY
ncbi:Ig-like domain-containing protein [Catenovulum agarivorans]|uniref:Ig-like domain-containing protein n=1 Tax=Catenovulum agarivorans TaxID=1172192 RepID=UPI0002ED5CB1|nr:Ig-like domain-containing protein [Catenovulum agarivorans]